MSPPPYSRAFSGLLANRRSTFTVPLTNHKRVFLCPHFKQKPRDTDQRTFALDHRPKAKPRAMPQVRELVRDPVQLKTTSSTSYLIHGLSLVNREEKKPGPSAARRDDQSKDTPREQGRGCLEDHDPTCPQVLIQQTYVDTDGNRTVCQYAYILKGIGLPCTRWSGWSIHLPTVTASSREAEKLAVAQSVRLTVLLVPI